MKVGRRIQIRFEDNSRVECETLGVTMNKPQIVVYLLSDLEKDNHVITTYNIVDIREMRDID